MTRNTVQETASLHESAVQRVAQGITPPRPRRPRKAPVRAPEVTTITVHPLVWEAAQSLLGNSPSYTRIEIVSESEVWVR